MKKSTKSRSQRNNVASEPRSFLVEPVVATMAYSLHDHHALFWKPDFDWLKIIDPVAELSEHTSRHVATKTFKFHQNLIKLKISWSTESECQQFMSRKELHDDNEKKSFHTRFLS